MKKQKSVIYLLLLLVVLIWSTIIIRVVTVVSDDNVGNISKAPMAKRSTATQRKDYSLSLNYRDPFSKTIIRDLRITSPTKKIISPIVKEEKKVEVRYFGTLGTLDQGSVTAFVQINGKPKHLKVNDGFEKLIVKKITKDSIQVLVNGNVKWIVR